MPGLGDLFQGAPSGLLRSDTPWDSLAVAMRSRWSVLALVVVARTAMGFQFQSIAAVGPLLVADLDLSYAQLGTLIGLYLLPGVFLSMPGGLLAARLGDRVMVLSGLALMMLGGLGLAVGESWTIATGARLASGAGGVLLSLQLTKIVTDWFAGRELATALGVMLSTWPLGIALGLICLGALAAAITWRAAMLATVLFAALAFGLILLLYRERPPPAPDSGRPAARWWALSGRETALTVVSGVGWAAINAALILVLSFGPKLLVERGLPPARANLVVSWTSLLSIVTVPLGGALLDRVRWRDVVIAVGTIGAAVASAGFALGGPAVLWTALVGLLIAPAAGVVALPGEVLSPRSRGTGFGLFYALSYAGMGLVPIVGGALVDRRGGPAALWLAAALWLTTLLALVVFRALQRRWPAVGPGA
jgi:predicted MFS family arabinose efflux permease